MTLRIRSVSGVYNQTPQVYSNNTSKLIISKIWNRQPDRVVGVDWENPLSRGLVWQGTPVDQGLPFSNRATIVGNFPVSIGLHGRAWRGATQNSDNYVRLERTNAFSYTAQVTYEALIFVRAFNTAISNYISGIISQYQATGVIGPILRFGSGGAQADASKLQFNIIQSGVQRQVISASLTAQRLYHVLGSYDGATLSLYINGVRVANLSVTGVFDNSASNFISIGSDAVSENVTLSRSFNGDIFLARIYNVGKKPAEVASLAANPWQLFATQELQIGKSPRIYYVAGPSSSWSTPTSAEIIAGKLAGGATPTAAWSESAPTYTAQPFSFSQPASGLTLGTKYRAAAVYQAATSNVTSNVIESPIFLAGGATLSSATVTNIGYTTVTPQVTVSY